MCVNLGNSWYGEDPYVLFSLPACPFASTIDYYGDVQYKCNLASDKAPKEATT